MKKSVYKTALLFFVLFSSYQNSFSISVNGPTTVCPKGTYTYSISNVPIATSWYRWSLSYTGFGVGVVDSYAQGSSNMNVTLNSQDEGNAYIVFEALLGQGGITLESYGLIIQRQLPRPSTPNLPSGVVLFCGANENVSVTSSPYISYNPSNPSDIASCLFHCAYLWQSPAGWNFQTGINSPSNNAELASSSNTLLSPSGVSAGYNGQVYVVAEHSQCGYNGNTSSTAPIWVGTTTVGSGQINGNFYTGGIYNAPGGFASLIVQINGGGTANWYIASGSGSVITNYNYCDLNFTGNVTVIVETSNRCGTGGSYTFYLSDNNGGGGMRIAPNPAKDKLSLIFDNPNLNSNIIQSISLIDNKNKTWFSADEDQLKKTLGDKSSFDIITKDYPRGTYYLHSKIGGNTNKQQIILE